MAEMVANPLSCTSHQLCNPRERASLESFRRGPRYPQFIVLVWFTCPLGTRVRFLKENWKIRCSVGKIEVHYTLVAGNLPVKGNIEIYQTF